ncbi:unnamed protein product [Vitrella brassicaformis CCMP3155]|uniref:Autophagy protein 5 n=1 Tax=Vitrella brassicaformis (strain CCMP3155) TaxID=1169540 RepID=A0A0G4GXN8_VITBC|nr:unnamed protein product [Vitrella brassicaformis CCMP3155]|eukprot:CEM35874.1 unnamed protein product [Vitrella brassicaformis CCMP3155]
MTALPDEAVNRGCILVQVRLHETDLSSLRVPTPYFKLVSRLSYLPVLYGDIYDHYKSYILPDSLSHNGRNLWLEHDNIPLQWHLPVGVLFDALFGGHPRVPWQLTVHFSSGTPEQHIEHLPEHIRRHVPKPIPMTGSSAVNSFKIRFLNTLKQSLFLLHGTSVRFASLSKSDQTDLMDAVVEGRVDDFWSIARRVDLTCSAIADIKSVSIRLHVYGPPHLQLLRAFEPASSSLTSVRCLLRSVLPQEVADMCEDSHDDTLPRAQVLVHGVCASLDCSVRWLALYGLYCDQCLHIVVRLPGALT